MAAALVTALSLAQPALAEDATGAPAADATSSAAATNAEPSPATEPATPEPEPEPPAEPTPPEPAPQDPPSPPDDTASEPTEPPPAEEPAAEVVTMEQPAAPDPCTEASEAEGAQAGTCETAAADDTAESPQAACDAGSPSTCPEQAESVPPPTATAPTVAAAPTAPPAAHAAPVVLVVSLAPEPAAVPAEAVAAAELDDSTAQASVQAPSASLADAPAVELAGVAVHVARLAEAETFDSSVAAMWGVPAAGAPMGTTPLTYLPTVNGVIATGTIVHGARASPRERDGHRVVATKAEEQEPPSAAVGPRGPLENQGVGASGGSAGGVAGAASLRFFAIATTPLRFDFPSTFSHAPLASGVPEGALEAAPTTRPG